MVWRQCPLLVISLVRWLLYRQCIVEVANGSKAFPFLVRWKCVCVTYVKVIVGFWSDNGMFFLFFLLPLQYMGWLFFFSIFFFFFFLSFVKFHFSLVMNMCCVSQFNHSFKPYTYGWFTIIYIYMLKKALLCMFSKHPYDDLRSAFSVQNKYNASSCKLKSNGPFFHCYRLTFCVLIDLLLFSIFVSASKWSQLPVQLVRQEENSLTWWCTATLSFTGLVCFKAEND